MRNRLTGKTGTFSHYERYNPFDDGIEHDKENLGFGRKKDNPNINYDRIIGDTDIISFTRKTKKYTDSNKSSITKDNSDYYVGMQVMHLQFGSGVVVGLTATKVKIKFDNRARGIKDFDRKTVFKGNIVMPLKTVMKKVNLRNQKNR